VKCGHCKGEGHNRRKCPGLAKQKPKRAAGRPRKSRYERVFADLSDPPRDSLELAEWCQQISAKALRETLQGRGNRELNQEIRSFSATVIKLIPAERLLRLKRQLEQRRSPKKPERKARGPEPEPVPSGDNGARLRG
jgi:hypothetical protein